MSNTPPSSWMVVTAVAANFDYPTNGAGGTSTTATNSHLIMAAFGSSTGQSQLIAQPSRKLNVRVWGYLIVVAPGAATTLTIQNHGGTVSHVSAVTTGAGTLAQFTVLGSGIFVPGGLRCQLAAAATVNVYYSEL